MEDVRAANLMVCCVHVALSPWNQCAFQHATGLQRDNTRMETPDTQLALTDDRTPVLPDLGAAVNGKYRLIGARLYVAAKAGLEVSDVKKQSMAQVKALAIDAGATETDVKQWVSEYDSFEARHRRISRTAIAIYASNPDVRQKFSLAVNAKGQVIGANASFRKESGKSATARLALADKRIAELESQLATQALPA